MIAVGAPTKFAANSMTIKVSVMFGRTLRERNRVMSALFIAEGSVQVDAGRKLLAAISQTAHEYVPTAFAIQFLNQATVTLLLRCCDSVCVYIVSCFIA